MANVNSNLSNLYSLWKEKQSLTSTTDQKAKQKEIDNLVKEQGSLLFDVVGNDEKVTYKDLLELANGLDLDGKDGITDEEKSFLNDLLNGKITSSTSYNIGKYYSTSKDTDLTSAEMEDLVDFVAKAGNRGNIVKSSDKLDIQLEEVNEKLNQKLLNSSNSNSINKDDVTKLAELEMKLEAANAHIAGKIGYNGILISDIFGDDIANVDADYVEELTASIKSLQMQLQIPNGDTSALNSSQLKNYNNYKTTAQTNFTNSFLGGKTIDVITDDAQDLASRAGYSAQTIANKNYLIAWSNSHGYLTFDYNEDREKWLAVTEQDDGWNRLRLNDGKSTYGSGSGSRTGTKKIIESITTSSTTQTREVQYVVEKEVEEPVLLDPTQPADAMIDTGELDPETFHDPTKPADAMVETSELDPETFLDPTKPADALIETNELDPETLLDPTQPADAMVTTRVWVEEKPAEKTEAEVAGDLEKTKGEIDSLIGEVLSVSGNVLQNANETTFGTQDAIDDYKKDNEYAPATEAAIAAAKAKFLNTVKDHIETTLGETLANEFARICIDEYPEKKTSEEFNALADSQKGKYDLDEKEIAKGTYKLTDEEKESGMDVRYKKYCATYDIEKSDRDTIVNNLLDKLFGTINSTKPTEGHWEEQTVRNDSEAEYKKVRNDSEAEYKKVRNDENASNKMVPNDTGETTTVTQEVVETKTVTDTVVTYDAKKEEHRYKFSSPLSLDANGDGVKTSDEKVNFDIDGDGILDLINDSADAVLVFDADGNGIAGENGLEVFGDNTDIDGDGVKDGFKNGFDALRALGEKEGLLGGDDLTLDADDIAKLQEKYGFGVKFGYLGETQSLSDIGVTEINFGKSNETQTIENFDGKGNNLMTQEGATFKINGKTNVFADIWHRKYNEEEDEEE